MRVGMYYNNHDVKIEEMPKPQIGTDEILIKVIVCGICGSDVLEWYRIKKAPIVLGHEIGGEIVEVGDDVDKYEIGQRVFVSHHVPCNTCYYCLRGHHTACETLHNTNFYPGGFAEYIRIPALNIDRGVFSLPNEITYDQAVFVEPLSCVIRAQRLVNLKPGQTVAVIGSGISGLLHIMLAKALSAGRIIATDIDKKRLEMAKKLGAEAVFNAIDDIPTRIRRSNTGRLADLVIVCAGVMSAFKQALKSVDKGGIVLCFATSNPGEDLPVPINEFWRNEIKLMTSYGNAPIDAIEAIELIRARRIPVEKLISHKLPLSEIQEGFIMTANRKDLKGNHSLKVIIELQR